MTDLTKMFNPDSVAIVGASKLLELPTQKEKLVIL